MVDETPPGEISDDEQNSDSNSRPRAGKRWTDEERMELIRMVHQGLSWAEIAAALGRSETSVMYEFARVVVDSKLKIPLKAKVLKDPTKLIIATTKKANKQKMKKLHQMGANVLVIDTLKGRVDLQNLMKKLGRLEITSRNVTLRSKLQL